MYYLSNSILIRNIIFHVILGKKHILVVYTDTDTVSVRLPYRHSVSTAHTQISYFRSTTTLRDTKIHPFLKNFLNFSVISFKKSKVHKSFITRNWSISQSHRTKGRNDVRLEFLSITIYNFWVVMWVRVCLKTLKKYRHSAGTGEHPKILGVSVHYILVHDDIFSKESGKRVPKMCHRTQKKHYRIYIYM